MTTEGLVLVIGAVALGLVQVITAWRNGAKIDVIKASVDGAATKSVEKIDRLEQELTAMRADMADKKLIATLLAQSVAKTAIQASELVKPEGEPA